MEVLRQKMSELEHGNKMLEANYKSESQSERKELIEKLAIEEVKVRDLQGKVYLKENELLDLKNELASLNSRLKDSMARQENQKVELYKSAKKDEDHTMDVEYLKDELQRAIDTNKKLNETIKQLEDEAARKERQSIEADLRMKEKVDELQRNASENNRADIIRLQDEISSLKNEIEREKNEHEKILQEKESQKQKQKAEWADVRILLFIIA